MSLALSRLLSFFWPLGAKICGNVAKTGNSNSKASYKFKKFGKVRQTKRVKTKIKKVLRYIRKNKITSYFINTKIYIRKKHKFNNFFYNNLYLKRKLFKLKNFKNYILREKFYHTFVLKKRFR